jgi:GntR family transcriptional regulator
LALDLQIATGGSTPIYRQIVDQICQAIAAGALGEGYQLSSVRALAEQLVVNPNTVARAYAELARHGLVESRQGRGFFVNRRRSALSEQERLRRFDRAVESFLNEAHLLDFSTGEIQEALKRKLTKTTSHRRGGDDGR